jgi:glycosyltransferase involved in cell wall biosynthesis
MSPSIGISVVIPAKNRATTLPGCLDSLLAQTYSAAEIIVVDDGSTDSTREVVESYADRGVVYAWLPNGKGAQAARNHGVQIARYDWIAFQDSDDVWLPNKLAIQVEALKAHGFDSFTVVHGDGLKYDEATGLQQPLPVPLTAGKCYEKLLLQAAPMFPSLLVSRAAIFKAGGLDNDCPAYQEWDTAIRLARYCEFVHIQQPLFVWRWHAGETISKDYRRDVMGFDYVINSHKQEIISIHGHKAWRRIKTINVARALRGKLWGDANDMLASEALCPSFAIARLFVKAKFYPRGASILMRLLAV